MVGTTVIITAAITIDTITALDTIGIGGGSSLLAAPDIIGIGKRSVIGYCFLRELNQG